MSWRQQAKGERLRRPRAHKNDGTLRARPVDWEGREQTVLIRWLLGEKMRGEPVGGVIRRYLSRSEWRPTQ